MKKTLSFLKLSPRAIAYIIPLILCLACSFHSFAQERDGVSSDQRQISLLISSPSTDAVYTRYGHAAIRVINNERKTDITYNYGIFDFNEPNFLYHFVKGQTDYWVEAVYTPYYVEQYVRSGRGVSELILNLTDTEAQKVEEYLNWNIRPENRLYRYNFFFDNCANRLIKIIQKTTNGKLDFPNQNEKRTWRELINNCSKDAPWIKFGMDLALGSQTDRFATAEEQMFLPNRILDLLPQTLLIRPDGSSRKLVKETRTILTAQSSSTKPSEVGWPSPLLIPILLAIISAMIVIKDIRRRKISFIFDSILLFIVGLSGCFIFFLAFLSVHPHTNPNYILFLLHPIHLFVGVPLTAIPRLRKAGFVYHFINFAELSSIGLIIWFLPQQIVIPIFVLGISLWMLSLRWILINRWKKNTR